MSNSKTAEPPAAAPDSGAPIQPQQTHRTRCATNTAKVGAFEQALALREQLCAALASTKGLIQAMKAEKRGQKSLKLALESLKQLQAAA